MTLADFGPWGPPKRRATLYGPSQSRHILTDRHYNVSLTSHSPLLIRQRTTKATQQIRVGPWRLFQTDTASKAPTNIWQRHSTTLYNSQSLFSSFFLYSYPFFFQRIYFTFFFISYPTDIRQRVVPGNAPSIDDSLTSNPPHELYYSFSPLILIYKKPITQFYKNPS